MLSPQIADSGQNQITNRIAFQSYHQNLLGDVFVLLSRPTESLN